MGIRATLSNQSSLERLVDRVRSAIDGSERTPAEAEDQAEAEGQVDAPGNLFHCSTCGTVYIADEKQFCPTCETEVEQVRSTLACRQSSGSSGSDTDFGSEAGFDSDSVAVPDPNS
ncbi:hypothetical protein [Halopiger aswanensis]|uniref:Small CPxCG-related zinc finger protein n=1 Tax=Halopiger aswanensis TaxID=148449 RepID=A0A419WGY9_9EURY|nr:hypothetical protein ATJ93_1532 [Halopiger aswanensis]